MAEADNSSRAGYNEKRNISHSCGSNQKTAIAQGEENETFYNLVEHIRLSDAGISSTEAVILLMSLGYGSAIVVLPYTIQMIGILPWLILVTIIILSSMYCTLLVKDACFYMKSNKKDIISFRDALPELAELAAGKKFRKLMIVILYVYVVCQAVAFILLVSTIFSNIGIIWYLPYHVQIRCWSVIIIIVSFPLMCIGSYNDLKSSAFIAVLSTSIALIAILVGTIMIKSNVHIDYQKNSQTSAGEFFKNFFSAYGTITFAANGPAYLLPNIYTFLKAPEKCGRAIVTTFAIIYILYLFSGIIPFAIFREKCLPSITSTLYQYYLNEYHTIAFRLLILLAQLCIGVHLVIACVLSLNPLFQNLERAFDIPKEFNWRRVITRWNVAVILLIVCCLFPDFKPVLSIVGGVPVTLIVFIFPIFIYSRLHELRTSEKIFLPILVGGFSIFLIGSMLTGIIDVAQLLHESFPAVRKLV